MWREDKSQRWHPIPPSFSSDPKPAPSGSGFLISHLKSPPGSGFNSPKVLSPRNKTCSRLVAEDPRRDTMTFPGPDGWGRWVWGTLTDRYRGRATAGAGADSGAGPLTLRAARVSVCVCVCASESWWRGGDRQGRGRGIRRGGEVAVLLGGAHGDPPSAPGCPGCDLVSTQGGVG